MYILVDVIVIYISISYRSSTKNDITNTIKKIFWHKLGPIETALWIWMHINNNLQLCLKRALVQCFSNPHISLAWLTYIPCWFGLAEPDLLLSLIWSHDILVWNSWQLSGNNLALTLWCFLAFITRHAHG